MCNNTVHLIVVLNSLQHPWLNKFTVLETACTQKVLFSTVRLQESYECPGHEIIQHVQHNSATLDVIMCFVYVKWTKFFKFK